MATTRLTLGAVLGTISSTAHTVTGSVEMVNQFVNMGQNRVSHMADEQKLKLTLERESLIKVALANHAMSLTSHHEEVAKFRNATAERATHFDQAYARGAEVLKKAFPDME